MKLLAQRLWNEPVLAAAVLGAIGLALGEQLVGDGFTTEDFAPILTIVGAGGIARRFVTPTRSPAS